MPACTLLSRRSFAALAVLALAPLLAGDPALATVGGDAAAPQEVYLSDLPPTLATGGLGTPGMDRSLQRKFIQMAGKRYGRGIGTSAESDIRFIINGYYTRFKALVGIDDVNSGAGAVRFQVWADERQVFDSGPLGPGMAPRPVDLDMSGVEEIKLIVTASAEGQRALSANWADARLILDPAFVRGEEDISSLHWETIGALVGEPSREGAVVAFPCENAAVRIEVCSRDLVRVRMVKSGEDFRSDTTLAIEKDTWPPIPFELSDCGDRYEIATGELVVRVGKDPLLLGFYEADGETVISRQEATRRMGWSGSRRGLWMELDAAGGEERFYGMGMQDLTHDLRGRAYHNWCGCLHGGSQRGEVFTVAPWFLSTAGYGFLLNNSFASWFRMGSENPRQYSVEAEDGELDFYFFRGPSFTRIMERFSELSGRMALPPKYALGLQYRGLGKLPNTWTQDQFIACGEKFRALGIPCDILGTEPGWATKKGNVTWSPETFPDPRGFAARMKELGFRVNFWIHQNITVHDTPFAALRPFQSDKTRYADWTMPGAGDAFFEVVGPLLFDLFEGDVGFKEDDHEANFTPDTQFPGGMTGAEYYNLYYMTWTKMLVEQVKKRYNRRYYGLATPSFVGGQRYPSCGYGDVWNFPDIRRTMINSGFTGIHFVPEVRSGQASKSHRGDNEYMRRSQMVFFSAFPQDNDWMDGVGPWVHGQKAQDCFREYARLRYRMIPYVYSCFREQNKTGLSLIRPMVMAFQDDPNTHALDDQYLFGPSLLVAPVNDFADEATRDVYLPEGVWYDWDTGERHEGRQTLAVRTPAGRLPLFARAGAIIPMAPDMDHVDQKPLDPLALVVYPGASATFTLYEDDGLTWDYEQGDYCETDYTLAGGPDGLVLDIAARRAPGAYAPPRRDYLLEVRQVEAPARVALAGKDLPAAADLAALQDVDGGWAFEAAARTLHVKFPDSGEAMQVRVFE